MQPKANTSYNKFMTKANLTTHHNPKSVKPLRWLKVNTHPKNIIRLLNSRAKMCNGRFSKCRKKENRQAQLLVGIPIGTLLTRGNRVGTNSKYTLYNTSRHTEQPLTSFKFLYDNSTKTQSSCVVSNLLISGLLLFLDSWRQLLS